MALAGSEKSYSWTFFVVSQILIVLTLYSLYDEGVVRRPWKDYQYEFNELQRQVAEQDLANLEKKYKADGTDQKLKDLQLKLEQAQIARESKEYSDAAQELKEKQIQFDDHELQVKFNKSILDSYYYEYKHAYQHGHDYKKEEKAYADLKADIEKKTKELAEEKKSLEPLKAKLAAYDDQIKSLKTSLEMLQKPITDARAKIEAIDFRPIEIKQTIIDDFGKGGNIYWGRVDRCNTCHVAIDKGGFEDVTKAFRLTVVKNDEAKKELLKQKPELKNFIVTENKKQYLQALYGSHPKQQELIGNHPIEQFGCTACHGGDGRGVNIRGETFGEGDKAHAYHHHAVEPLLRGKQMESNCLACHSGQIEVPGAPNLTKGLELFVQLGCQNCHAVDNYDKLYRVAPELNKVGNKVQTVWMVDWLKNPFNYMPNSRMPHFGLSDDEVVAVASYLVANSQPVTYKHQMTLSGNAKDGEALFSKVGCQGCHSASSAADAYQERSRAPHLARLSAKVKEAEWVYDWIKDPKNYSKHARMPSLRLSDQEAADITAYLMQQSPDYKKVIAERSATLATRVNSHDQVLIEQGKGIINNRGCYSCHLMKGFENGERIGPALTAEALKENFEFDFGDALKEGLTFKDVFGRKVFVGHNEEERGQTAESIHAEVKAEYQGVAGAVDEFANVEETWQSWIRNKIRFPMEIYAHDRAVLKMPNFNLSEEEQDSLVVFLKSLTNRTVPYALNASMRDKNQNVISGQRLMAEKNCLGCHVVSDFGGDVNAKVDELDNAEFGAMTQHYPPELTRVGEKIRPEWLTAYLRDPSMKYRPAEYIRMPTFGFEDAQLDVLAKSFASMVDSSPKLSSTDYTLDPKLVEAGRTLASVDNGLACFACHILDGKKPGDDVSMWAPDWKHVRARLQFGFITKWIQNSQHYQKFSVMPAYLDSAGTAMPGILDGTEAKQLEALRAYILSVGDTRTYDEMKNDAH